MRNTFDYFLVFYNKTFNLQGYIGVATCILLINLGVNTLAGKMHHISVKVYEISR